MKTKHKCVEVEILKPRNTSYMEIRHTCKCDTGLACHVEYCADTGKIHSIIPFYRYNFENKKNASMNPKDLFEENHSEVMSTAMDAIKDHMRSEPMYNPWISCGVRYPRREDADPYNHVIAWDAIHQQAVIMYPEDVPKRKGVTHWKSTQLPQESAPI